MERGLSQVGPHIWLHLPQASVGRRKLGRRSPAGHRGPGWALLFALQWGAAGHLLGTGALRWGTTTHTPCTEAVFEDAHSLQSWTQLCVQHGGEFSKAHLSLEYHGVFKNDGSTDIEPSRENTDDGQTKPDKEQKESGQQYCGNKLIKPDVHV